MKKTEEISEKQDKTDNELVKLALKDQNDFLFLIRRYEERLLRYILRISNFSHEDAEDVLQNVFIKVWENLNNFDSSLKFSSWIYRISHNETVSSFRKKKSRGEDTAVSIEEDLAQKLSSDINIEKEVDRKILSEKMKEIIKKQDLKYREVLVLKFLEEKDYREISDILKKPMGTVATLIKRAKENLKKELEKVNL